MQRRETAKRLSLRRRLDCAVIAFVGMLIASTPAMVFAFVHPMALGQDVHSEVQSTDAAAELHCLALNIYHEARGESIEGKLAVGQVTINRVRSARYRNSICKVVWQRGQFSWTRDGRPDVPENLEAWEEALRIARITFDFTPHGSVERATHYHAVYVRPYWAKVYRPVRRIGKHIFYEPPGRT